MHPLTAPLRAHPRLVRSLGFVQPRGGHTSDVAVSTQRMRRLVLLQSLLSFGFNTAILAFTINLAASMF